MSMSSILIPTLYQPDRESTNEVEKKVELDFKHFQKLKIMQKNIHQSCIYKIVFFSCKIVGLTFSTML